MNKQEYESMADAEREALLNDIYFALPVVSSDHITGAILSIHDYVKVSRTLTGAARIEWNDENRIGDAPHLVVTVDQSGEEVSAAWRAWMGWGGARPGSGRKPTPTETHKIKRAVTLSPANDAYIMRQQRPSEAYSAALDRLLTTVRGTVVEIGDPFDD